jgi:hypothetical protein
VEFHGGGERVINKSDEIEAGFIRPPWWPDDVEPPEWPRRWSPGVFISGCRCPEAVS